VNRKADTHLRVLHVTESYGGGVATAIRDYARNTPEFQHSLAYVPRSRALGEYDLLSSFAEATPLAGHHLDRIRQVRPLLTSGRYDIVHAHSSFGGAYVRLAAQSRSLPIVYTPHCYAFERRDISRPQREMYRFAESILANRTSVFACCSQREATLSQDWASLDRVVHIPNVAPFMSIPGTRVLFDGSTSPHVVIIGRVSPQKDPLFFAQSVQAIRASYPGTTAAWYGDGSPSLRARLEASGIRVSGWWPLERIIADMAGRPSVYLHSAAWEGFPLTLLEVAAVGFPIVARSIPALAEVPEPSKFARPCEAPQAIRRVGQPGVASSTASAILTGHDDATQRERLVDAYERARR
jgi:glycosyltransferase involved in cell wall biosynthesis